MVNIYWLRRKVGDAVWLWMALNAAVQQPVNAENEWFPVQANNPIGDGQIGQALFADEEAVIAWRERLESLGLIRTTLLTDQDPLGLPRRRYEVLNLAFGATAAQTPLAPQHVN